MTTDPTPIIADTLHDAGNALSRIDDTTRHLGWKHDYFTSIIHDADEIPLRTDLNETAEHAQKLVEAAQEFQRKTLYLLALAGGYDQKEAA